MPDNPTPLAVDFVALTNGEGFSVRVTNVDDAPAALAAISPLSGVRVNDSVPLGVEFAPRKHGPVRLLPGEFADVSFRLAGLFPETNGNCSVSATLVWTDDAGRARTVVVRGNVELKLPDPELVFQVVRSRRQQGDYSLDEHVTISWGCAK